MMGDEAPLPTPPKSIMGRLAQYAYSPNGKTASGFGSGSCSGPGSRVRATRDDGIVKIEHDNDDDVIFTGQSPAETIDVKPNVRRSINSDAENGAPVTPRKRAQADIKTEDEPELEAEDTVHTSPFLVRRAPSRRAKEASRRNYNVDDNGSDGSESEWDSGRSGRLKRRRTRASVNEAAAAAANEEEDAEVDELEDDPPKPEPSDENDGSTPRTPGRNGAAHGWRRPKAYADPVTGAYAHIPGLRDHLRPGLDVVFIGINPGQRSGARGHYFCHPTNKFQRALHQGGFTARLIAPEEDGSLLEVGVGLTNLVNRVTAQAAELSPHEQRLGVAPLARKLADVAAPRVACFVGKGIWDTFAGVVTRAIKDKEAVPRRDPAAAAPATPGRVVQYTLQGGQATPTRTAKAEPDAEPNAEPASPLVKAEPDTASPAARNGRGKAKPKAKGRAKPEPVVYDAPQRLRLRATSREGFVYLWVVPNTSGLERTPLAQQVEYFSALRAFADSLARGEEPQGAFVDVDIEQVEAFGQTLESR